MMLTVGEFADLRQSILNTLGDGWTLDDKRHEYRHKDGSLAFRLDWSGEKRGYFKIWSLDKPDGGELFVGAWRDRGKSKLRTHIHVRANRGVAEIVADIRVRLLPDLQTALAKYNAWRANVVATTAAKEELLAPLKVLCGDQETIVNYQGYFFWKHSAPHGMARVVPSDRVDGFVDITTGAIPPAAAEAILKIIRERG